MRKTWICRDCWQEWFPSKAIPRSGYMRWLICEDCGFRSARVFPAIESTEKL